MREKKKSKNDRIIHELGSYISDITPIAEMIEELNWFLPQQKQCQKRYDQVLWCVGSVFHFVEGNSVKFTIWFLWRAAICWLHLQFWFPKEAAREALHPWTSRLFLCSLHSCYCLYWQQSVYHWHSYWFSNSGKRQVRINEKVSLALAMEKTPVWCTTGY